MTTIQQLQSMTPRQVVALAKKIIKQCHDKKSIADKLGNDDDFFSAVCKFLIEFKLGARELRPGCRLYLAVCGLARGRSKGNWMSDSTTEFDIDLACKVAEVFYEEKAAAIAHSLADVPSLTALDKLMILHATAANVRQTSTTADLADFFGISCRAVRMRKEKLHADLIMRFNLKPNFFEEKAEPPMPHTQKKVVEEKDPLANFVPMPSNFNAFRRVGIR